MFTVVEKNTTNHAMHIAKSVILAALLLHFPLSAQTLIVIDDFNAGDYSAWSLEEDFYNVTDSALISVVEVSEGDFAAKLQTGWTSHGVFVCSLYQDRLRIPESALTLEFDVKFLDIGPDTSGGSSLFLDQLSISLLNDAGNIDPLFVIDAQGYYRDQLVLSVEELDNGFIRVVTDISDFSGFVDTKIFFGLYDEDDGRLSQAFINNVFIVIPEPATLFLFVYGTSLIYLKNKKV